MVISLLAMKIPDQWFKQHQHLFRTWKWERKGQIWNDIFQIRKWKKKLPDASLLIKAAFSKKSLQGATTASFKKFIIETQRGELTHWLSMLPAPLFFIWNPKWAGMLILIYAFFSNVPFILVQRYNRPRLIRMLEMKKD